ncbi:MAG: N-acyl homoserine lactone hydrolase [Solirubrobacterales bacterium]|nr:N-acyl homoserine lactone hydrolase [Solirubrobacterales bacterium]
MLNVGWVTAPAGIWRRGDDLDRKTRFPVPAYVIETAGERILVDTGLHPAAAADSARHYEGAEAVGIFGLELEQSIGEQVDLATVTKVVLTHLHFDHAGGLAALPRSVPIVVQHREWEAGQDAAAIERNFYLPVDYALADGQVTLIDGDHDLLGDGSIELMLTPGHTPGHQSVRVGERLVIGADVSHFASGLDDHRFPIFADDFEAQAASADRLRAMRDAGALVLPGHDPEVLEPGRLPL